MRTEESLLVDLETGEITTDFGTDATTEILPQVARTLRAMHWKRQTIEKYLADEIERITAICDHKVAGIDGSIAHFEGTAQRIMAAEGYNSDDAKMKKLSYPGLGAFRFGKSRESVNDDVWNEMTDDEKVALYNSNMAAIDQKVRYQPNKKWIKEALNSGGEIQGFSMNGQHETFTFKPEE
jgi:hypothetical protein